MEGGVTEKEGRSTQKSGRLRKKEGPSTRTEGRLTEKEGPSTETVDGRGERTTGYTARSTGNRFTLEGQLESELDLPRCRRVLVIRP